MWGFMYLPSTSPFSYITEAWAAGPIPFLDLPLLFPSVANIAIWGGVGFNMIIIYTALRGIPADIYDAARIDGASDWQIARRIKIPLIAPALVLTGLFSLIGTLQVYGEPTTLRPDDVSHHPDLGAADDDLPRRLHPGQPAAGLRVLGDPRRRHRGDVRRPPQGHAEARLRRRIMTVTATPTLDRTVGKRRLRTSGSAAFCRPSCY